IWPKSSSFYLLVALVIAFAVQGAMDFHTLYTQGLTRADKRWTMLAERSHNETSVPVVIGSPLGYLEAVTYAPPELRDRLVVVFDADMAIRLGGSDTADKANRLLTQFLPLLRVDDLAQFQAAHQKFMLYSGGPGDWFTQYLTERSYHLRLLALDGYNSLYIV